MARGHHPGSGPGMGRACLSPPVDCRDGGIVACTAGSGPDADARRQDARQGRGDAAGGGASPGAFRPRMATAGGPDGWRSWTATAWHGRRAPRAVPRTTPPRRGFLGRMNVYGQINVYGVTTKSERHKRSYWTRTADGNGIGGRKAPVPYGS